MCYKVAVLLTIGLCIIGGESKPISNTPHKLSEEITAQAIFKMLDVKLAGATTFGHLIFSINNTELFESLSIYLQFRQKISQVFDEGYKGHPIDAAKITSDLFNVTDHRMRQLDLAS